MLRGSLHFSLMEKTQFDMALNHQQQKVIAHGTKPLLVVAGAGTGKTTVMAHRAAALIARGTPLDRLLLLTFTRRAAEELKSRVASVLEKPEIVLPWCGTFHSIAVRLLRRFGRYLDIPPQFSILDETDAREMLWAVAETLFGDQTKDIIPAKGLLYKIYSYQVNTRKPLEDVLQEMAPRQFDTRDQLLRIFTAYGERKIASVALDFDDLLVKWIDLLRSPHFDCSLLFEVIMVDEYQDTNLLQAEILAGLCRQHSNITVVGDDAQAIYAFRGATVENILGFEAGFPNVTRLHLEQNYRSTQEILDAANALWNEAERGFKKQLVAHRGSGPHRPRLVVCEDDWEQSNQIAEAVIQAKNLDNIPLREQAVLFRATHHSFRLEMVLQKFHIPYRKFGGQRFADSAHIKDVLAFLRCRENARDEAAWRRIFSLLPGIGPATAMRFCIKLAAGAENVLPVLMELKFPAKAQPYRDRFMDLFRRFWQEELPLLEQASLIIDFYKPLLEFHYDLPELREAGLRELLAVAGKYENRRQFLDELQVGDDSLVEGADERGEKEYLTLSTIHSAKGCEWRRVHVINLIEGGLPSGPSQDDNVKIEEERRLLYVAMTRAKEQLALYQPRWRETIEDGKRKRAICRPSRFLTPEVLACLESNDGTPADEPIYVYDSDDGWETKPGAAYRRRNSGGYGSGHRRQ